MKKTELERLLLENQNPPVNQCLLRHEHGPHPWWYTSSGGGHMLGEDLKYEKGLKKHICPGFKRKV